MVGSLSRRRLSPKYSQRSVYERHRDVQDEPRHIARFSGRAGSYHLSQWEVRNACSLYCDASIARLLHRPDFRRRCVDRHTGCRPLPSGGRPDLPRQQRIARSQGELSTGGTRRRVVGWNGQRRRAVERVRTHSGGHGRICPPPPGACDGKGSRPESLGRHRLSWSFADQQSRCLFAACRFLRRCYSCL
jgi:hypothetical protein